MKIIEVTTVEQLAKFWPFFRNGQRTFNRLLQNSLTDDAFFRLLSDIALNEDRTAGKVLVATTDKEEPLCYFVAFDNTSRYKRIKSLLIFAVYTDSKIKGTARTVLSFLENWARNVGYTELQASSPRTTGAARRLFESIFGFTLRAFFFTKTL